MFGFADLMLSICRRDGENMTKKITKWEPDNFELQTTNVWDFPERGNWATHDGKYRGNWSPYIPRNLMLRYSEKGDIVLDQFCGGGTTPVEAKLLGRNIVACDINPSALERCIEKCDFEEGTGEIFLKQADARNLDFIPDGAIDLICTHPPYANIIQYSDDITGDLSRLDVEPFLNEMKKVALECWRTLKVDHFCAILMGDIRRKGYVIPLTYEIMKIFIDAGFRLKETIVKEQHNCKATGFWVNRSIQYNFLLLAHEHLFVFRK